MKKLRMTNLIKIKMALLTLAALLLMIAVPAQAQVTLGFDNITNNDADDAAIGEAQLFVDVEDAGGGQVLFTFRNTGSNACFIAQVYFDDRSSSPLVFAGLIDADDGTGGDPNVDFSTGGSPPNLPGGNNADPSFNATWRASADNPSPQNGVNPGESLGILFNLQSGKTFEDVLDDLESGALRIGIHVQGFASGGSESFVNEPYEEPEPGTIIVEKQTDPDGADASFVFFGDAAGTIGDGEQIVVGNLQPGTYTSQEGMIMPMGWDLTSIECDDDNSTGDVSTRTATFQLEAGETVKCTFTNTYEEPQLASLGDYVWKDTDKDGIQDPGEPGIAGVTVNLYDCDGNLIGSTTTDDNGLYLFFNLTPGDYKVEFIKPDGYVFSPQDQGADDAVDSDADPTTGQTACTTLDPGENDRTWDAGLYQPCELGTIIVEKQTDPDGAPTSFTFAGTAAGTISDGGQIVVSNLPPGTYTSTEAAPTGLWNLTHITCEDPTEDSSGNVGTRTATFQLEAGETVKCTFYNQKPSAISLVSFTAEASAGSVTLAWETGAELDNAGFNLYRAASPNGPWTQINDALIAAQGDPVAGGSYTFTDTPGYGTFYYQLEDVDYFGVSTLHGPVSVKLGSALRLPWFRPALPQF